MQGFVQRIGSFHTLAAGILHHSCQSILFPYSFTSPFLLKNFNMNLKPDCLP